MHLGTVNQEGRGGIASDFWGKRNDLQNDRSTAVCFFQAHSSIVLQKFTRSSHVACFCSKCNGRSTNGCRDINSWRVLQTNSCSERCMFMQILNFQLQQNKIHNCKILYLRLRTVCNSWSATTRQRESYLARVLIRQLK